MAFGLGQMLVKQISELLIEKETLDAPDFEALFAGIPRPEQKLTQPPQRKPVAQPAQEEPAKPQPLPGLKPGLATFSLERRDPDGLEE